MYRTAVRCALRLYRLAVPPAVATVLCLSATPGAAEERPVSGDGSPTTLVSRYRNANLRLRGDYEPNNLILLVWQPEWEETVKQVAVAAAKQVPVHVMIPRGVWSESRAFRRWAKQQCVPIGFHRYDTAWVRDYGPIQVMEGEHVTWRDFAYDTERPRDDEFPASLASVYRVPLELASGRLDGGGLVSNGQGLCVMTEMSIDELSLPEGDPDGLDRFVAGLGCHTLAKIQALPEEQTGHADVSVQFLRHDLVAVAEMDARQAPVQAELLDEAVRRIQEAAATMNLKLDVVRVPMIHKSEVFFSYVNAVRAGSSLLVPSYKEVPAAVQESAFEALTAALPGMTIVPIVADEVVEYGGALHCITLGLQVPDGHAQMTACPEVAKPVKLAHKRMPKRRTRRRM